MPRRHHVHSLLSLLLHVLVAASATSSSLYNRSSNCTRLLPDADIVRKAFLHVGNFPLPRRSACRPVRRLHFPSRNLTGVLRWEELANLSSLLTLDLSGNSLQGDVHSAFWRAPSLRAVDVSGNVLGGALRFEPSASLASLNVSGNRFTSVDGVDRLAALEYLDLSGNIIDAVPEGLVRLARIRRLNLSRNSMVGLFPDDFPQLDGIDFLNISYNSFSGKVDAHTVRKFGLSAFFQAGNASLLVEKDGPAPAPTSPTRSRKKHRRVLLVIVVCTVVAVTALVILAGCVACRFRRRKKDKDGKTVSWMDEEVAVGAVKVSATAPVVVLERPLMELTLADLAAATSGFGRESQLADAGGRSGAAYRAVLPGDLDVIVRVVEGAVAGVGEDDHAATTAAGFRELARLRHPNILPLLGYCIAGKEKLLLYEYMEKGDLHRWLHELPAGSMDALETSIDTSDLKEEDNQSVCDWSIRHRMILGIARGLAFLHQGWAGSSGRPIVHGHLVPTNVLLGDDLEPRISDFMHHGSSSSDGTPESDVYSFGVLVFELVTGQAKWDEATVAWARGVIRNKKAENIVDARLREDAGGAAWPEAEREAAECLQVGFLCTAPSPQKRPTMDQVVGVLKDIRPAPAD